MTDHDLVKQKMSDLAAKIETIVRQSSLEEAAQNSITSWLHTLVLSLTTKVKVGVLEIGEI